MKVKDLSHRLDSLEDRELDKLKEIYSETGQRKKEAIIDSELYRSRPRHGSGTHFRTPGSPQLLVNQAGWGIAQVILPE